MYYVSSSGAETQLVSRPQGEYTGIRLLRGGGGYEPATGVSAKRTFHYVSLPSFFNKQCENTSLEKKKSFPKDNR